MSNIIIREYAPSDKDPLNFLAMSATDDGDALLVRSSLRLLDFDGVLAFVAECDGELVGFNVGIGLPSGVLLPEGMYVDPDYRRQGTAKRLSEALEKASGCSVSMAYYKPELAPYYARLGYDSGDNLVVGIKELKA